MHKLLVGYGYTYLTRHVAAGDAGPGHTDSLVAYYESTGNPPGRGLGHGLAGLGDDAAESLRRGAAVTEAEMAAVFRDGCDPLTGDPLGRSYQGRANRPVVGFDLTFTVPKSASVLWALGDDATRKAVHAAHRAAVDQALDFVERKVARTRVGHAGCRQVRTRGVIAAAFDHWDTRTGDPNLHTHVVLATKVQGPDGAWRSLDGKTVHAATVTVSALYDALVADELARRLPVRWSHRSRGERRNPAFEIEGIDDVVDETHTVAAPGMAREDLYVGMSRGRDLNRVYVVTDGVDDDCVPGGASPATSYREVLDGILATSHAEPTATEIWESFHPGEPAPLPVPPLRAPHDYGRSVSSRPPAQAPAPTSGADALTRIL